MRGFSMDTRILSIAFGCTLAFAGAAVAAGADVYITGEARYHDLFNYDGKMVVAVIGHYESEQFTMEIFKEIISGACPQVAVKTTSVCTNPVHYM